MLIHANEKFVDGNTVYEVSENANFHTVCTYVYDNHGNYLFSTEDIDDFTKFYRLGWSKAEIHAGIKETWTIAKDRQVHIWDLHSFIGDEAVENWLNLETWEKLPVESVFYRWLEHDFEPIWDELEENSEDAIFDEDNARLIESVERLDALMKADPELVQLVD